MKKSTVFLLALVAWQIQDAGHHRLADTQLAAKPSIPSVFLAIKNANLAVPSLMDFGSLKIAPGEVDIYDDNGAILYRVVKQ